jgi:hypothetical protein
MSNPVTSSTVEAARRVVKTVAPKAEEIPYQMAQPRSSRTMWKLYRYAVGGANVVGIGTFPDHANLYFYRGVDLDDGSGLLKGGGKEMRSITLRSPADVERADVMAMVRKAFRLAAS